MKKNILFIGMLISTLSINAQTWEEQATAPTGTTQIEADINGTIYAVGPNTASNVFQKKEGDNAFTLLAGNGIVNDIAAYNGKLYAIGGFNQQVNSNIYLNSGSGWAVSSIPKGVLTDLDYNGKVIYGCNSSKSLYEANAGVVVNFTALSGLGNKVTKAADGTTIAVNDNFSVIYRTNKWDTISKTINIESISAASLSNVWAVDTDGFVYQFDNTTTSWIKKNGSNFKAISVDKDDQYVWTLSNDGKVYRHTLTNAIDKYSAWVSLGNAPSGTTTQIEVADNGDIYCIGNFVSGKGNIYVKKTTDINFDFYPGIGIAKDIAAHSGKILVIGSDNTIYEWKNNNWYQYSPVKFLTNIDINASTLVGNESNLKMSKHNFDAATSWSLMSTSIASSSIATDNTLVGINGVSSYIYNYQNSSWTTLSNNLQLSVISVGGVNNIWGLTSNGNIYNYSYTTNSWVKKLAVPQGAKSISLLENEAIYAISNDNKIYRADLINTVTGVDENINNKTILVYPNPAQTSITVAEFSQVFNLLGNKVAEGEGNIDVSSLQAGLYIVKSTNGTAKLVKE